MPYKHRYLQTGMFGNIPSGVLYSSTCFFSSVSLNLVMVCIECELRNSASQGLVN